MTVTSMSRALTSTPSPTLAASGSSLWGWVVAIVLLLLLSAIAWSFLRRSRDGGAVPLAIDTLDRDGAPTQIAADAARAAAAAATLDPQSFERAMESTIRDEVRETGSTDEPDRRP